jgi:hypothetical protein
LRIPRVRLLETGEQRNEVICRAVRAGQADAVPLLDVPRHVLEEDAVAA